MPTSELFDRFRSIRRSFVFSALIFLTLNHVAFSPLATACTRIVFLGTDGTVVTARSMDWKTDIGTKLWILPRGMARTGEASSNSTKWTSRYGSVIASAYDLSTSDGMNEKGLVANVLWPVEFRISKTRFEQTRPALSLWAQYLLDNFATVREDFQAAGQRHGWTCDRLPTPSMTVGTKTAETTSLEHSIGGVWRRQPSLREILLLWLVSFCLFVGFIAFLRNYFNLVDNFGDGSAYMSLASAIRHWDFRGVVIKQFWGLPYAMAAISRLTGVSDRTAMLSSASCRPASLRPLPTGCGEDGSPDFSRF